MIKLHSLNVLLTFSICSHVCRIQMYVFLLTPTHAVVHIQHDCSEMLIMPTCLYALTHGEWYLNYGSSTYGGPLSTM